MHATLLFDPGLGPALAELHSFSAYTVIQLPKHSYPRYICTHSNTFRHIYTESDTFIQSQTHLDTFIHRQTHLDTFIHSQIHLYRVRHI